MPNARFSRWVGDSRSIQRGRSTPEALHPALVHFPISLAFLIPIVSLAVTRSLWSARRKSRAWLAVVLLQGLLVVSGYVAAESGEGDEQRVEAVVAEHLIERHEESAELFLVLSAVTLLAMFGGIGAASPARSVDRRCPAPCGREGRLGHDPSTDGWT